MATGAAVGPRRRAQTRTFKVTGERLLGYAFQTAAAKYR
jgi:hypothetical protein